MASVLGLYVSDQVDDRVGVTHLIVVPGGRRRVKEIAIWLLEVLPGHKLDKSFGELDSGLGVKDGRPLVSDEVS